MEARIIGPEAELGEVHKGLNFFGHSLSREWSDVSLTPTQIEKAKGNRYVELRGHEKVDTDPAAVAQATNEAAEVASIQARLDELGVEYGPKAGLKTLQGKLDTAEKAKAKADEEEEADLAEAREKLSAAGADTTAGT